VSRRAARSEAPAEGLSRDSDNDKCPQFSHEAFRIMHRSKQNFSTFSVGKAASLWANAERH